MFGKWLKKHRIMRKGVTLAVLLAFFASFIATDAWSVAEIGEVSYTAEMEGPPPLQAETFTIPDYLATVRDYRKGTTNKMIIHIQDAHCNYDAQRRISEIIDYLTSQYGITEINLEGGKGSYDLAPFTGIINSDIRETVSDYFVKEGTVTGAEYFAINNPDKVTLWGVEETKLYMDNLSVYRGSLAYKEEAEGYLKNLSHLLSNLKMKIYSKELFDVDLKYSQYKANNLDFKDYLTFLLEKAKERGIIVKEYPNIYLLTQSLEQEEEINFKRANNQRDELVDSLQKILSKRSLEELVKNTVDFKAKRLSQYDYYEFLLERANLANIKLESYPDLQKYIVYISLYNAADKAAIMAELTTLEEDIKATLFQNDTQKRLSVLSKNLTLEKNMFAFSFTKEDWEYYSKNKASFGVRNFSSFIKREAPKYKITAQLDRNVGRLDGYRDKLEKFFSFSFKRDDAFLENLRFKGQKEGIEAAIIVTGGFHTENLCALLRKKGISYVSLMPNFTNKEGYVSPYFALLGGKEAKLEEFLDKAISYSPRVSTIAVRSLFSEMGVDIRDANMSKIAAQVFAHVLQNRLDGTNEPFVLQTRFGYITINQGADPREGSNPDVFFTANVEGMNLVASFYGERPTAADAKLMLPVLGVDGDTMTHMQQEAWIDMVGKAVGSEVFGTDAAHGDRGALLSALADLELTEEQRSEILRYIDAGKVHVWNESIGPVDGHPGANEIYLNPELFTQGPQGYRKAAVVLLHELGAAFRRPDSQNRLINEAYNRGDMSGVKAQAGLIITYITAPGAVWRGRGEDVDFMATTGTQMLDVVGFVRSAYKLDNPEEMILSKINELYSQGKMRDAGFLAGAMLEQIRALQESGELFGPKGAESGFAIFSEKVPIYVLAQMLNMYGNDRIERLLTTYLAGKRALGERLKSPDILPGYLRVRLLGDDEFKSFRDLLSALGYRTRDQIKRISKEWDDAVDTLKRIETYRKKNLPSKRNAVELKGLKRAWAREMREMHEESLADGDPKGDNVLFPEAKLKSAVRSAVLKGANTRFNWKSLPLDEARPRHFDFDRFWELAEMPWADVVYDIFVKLIQQPARFTKFTETNDRAGDIENRKMDIRDTLRALWEEGIAHELMGRTEAEREEVVDLAIRLIYAANPFPVLMDLEKLVRNRLNEEAKNLRNVFIDAIQHVKGMNQRGQKVTPDDFLIYITSNNELVNRPGMERVGADGIRWIVEDFLTDEMTQRMISYDAIDEITGKNDAEIENMFLVKLAKLSVFGLMGLRRSDFRAKHKGAGGIIERCTSDARSALRTGAVSSFPEFFERMDRRVYNIREDEVELLEYWANVAIRREWARPSVMTEPVNKEITPLLAMGVGMFNAGAMNGVHSEEKFLEDIDELKKRLAGKKKDPDAIKEVLAEFLKERYKELEVKEAEAEAAKNMAKDFLDNMSPGAILNIAVIIDRFAGGESSATKELQKLTTKSKLTDRGTSLTAKCVFKTPLLHARFAEPICTLVVDPAADLDALRGRIYRRTFEGAIVPIDDVRAYLSGLAERQKGKYVVVRRMGVERSNKMGGGEVLTLTMEFPDGEVLEVDPQLYLEFRAQEGTPLGSIFRKVDRYGRIKETLDSVKVIVNRYGEEHIVDTDVISAESPVPGMSDFLVIRQLRWDTPEWNRIEGMSRGERMRNGDELFNEASKEARNASSPTSPIIQDITASAEANLRDIMNLRMQIASMRARTLGVTPEGLKLYDAKSLVEMDGDVVWGLAVSIYRMINSSKDPLNFDIDAEITEDMISDYVEMINRGQVILAFRDNSPVGVLTFKHIGDSSEVVDLGVSPDIADNDTLINIRNSLMDQAMETLLKAPGTPIKSVFLVPTMPTLAFYSRYLDRVKTLSELSDFEHVRDDDVGRNAVQLRSAIGGPNVTCGTMTSKEHDDVEKGLRTQLRNFYESLGAVGRILSEQEADRLLIAKYGEELGITQADLDNFRSTMRREGVLDNIPIFFTMPEGWERGEMLFRVGERVAAAHFAERAKRIQVSLPFLTNNPFRSPSEAVEMIAGHEAKHIAEPDFGSSEDHDDEAIDLVRRVAAATRVEPAREEELAEAARRRVVQRSTHTVRSINSAENRNAGVIVVGKGPEGRREEVDPLVDSALTKVGRAIGKTGIGHRRQNKHIMTYGETTAGAIASVVFNAVQEGRKLIASVKEYDSCDVVANYSDKVNVEELIDALVNELGPEFRLSGEDMERIKDSLLTEGVVVVEGVRITLVKDSYTDFAYPDLMFRYALAREIAYYETARSEGNEAGMRSARELVLSHLRGGCDKGFVSEMEKIADAREFFNILYTAGLKVEKIDFESIREYINSAIETSISL